MPDAQGTNKVRRACDEYLPHPGRKSGLERSFDRWLTRHPEIPSRNATSTSGTGRSTATGRRTSWPWNWTAALTTPSSRTSKRDNRKNTWLQAHGIRILRVTDSRWRRDKKGVHHDLTTLLALAEVTRAA